jgi:hypothetical protein
MPLTVVTTFAAKLTGASIYQTPVSAGWPPTVSASRVRLVMPAPLKDTDKTNAVTFERRDTDTIRTWLVLVPGVWLNVNTVTEPLEPLAVWNTGATA